MSQPAEVANLLEFDQADRLRRALRVSNTSVQDMAEELGVERNTVGRYINGHNRANRATLIVWAMKTGVPVEWLESGELPRLDSNQRPFVSQFSQVSASQVSAVLTRLVPRPRTSESPRTAPAAVTPTHQPATTTATSPVGGAVVVDLATYTQGRRAGDRAGRRAGARTYTTRRPA